MSDSRDKYSVAPDFEGDNDPFAELSRIMGLEPRSEQARLPQNEDAASYELAADAAHEPAEETEEAYPIRRAAQTDDHAVDSLELDLGSELDRAFSRDFGAATEAAADGYEDYLSRDLSNDPYASNEPDPLDEWARSRTTAQVPHAAAEQASRTAATATLRDPYSYSTQQVSRALVGSRVEPAAVPDEVVEAQPEPEDLEEERYDFSLEDELAALLAKTRDEEEQPELTADGEDEASEGFSPFVTASGVAASAAPAFRSTPVSSRAAEIDDFPEIETVEIDDAPRSAAEEFEVPELPVEEEAIAAPAFDDLAAELEGAFDALDEPRVPKATEPVYAAAGYDEEDYAGDFDDALYGEADSSSTQSRSYDYSYRAADERYADFSYEDIEAQTEDLDDYADAYGDGGAVPAPARAPRNVPASSSRRTMMVAAAVAAVALFGGVGAFALFATGSDDAEPALVLADVEPIKVRPENPGGTVVPNQESATYRRVSAGPADAVPQQQELITTAEEPVDVAARTAPAIGLPSPEEDEVPDLDMSAALVPGVDADALSGTPKFDERIESVEQLVASADSQTIAVEPRRVRTMIVRPDGTIMAREEDAPQQAAAPAPQEPPAPAAPQQTQSALAPVQPALAPVNAPATDDVPAAAEAQLLVQPEAESDIPDPVLPQSVSVAPTPRPGNGSVAATTAPSPQPQAAAAPQQVAAATPQASLTAASSEWSMQIASQPSAESAQSTYQDLARRYGNLLQGRGVNIVRAEIDGRGTYYRVRIPAASRDDAVRLCASYQAAGGSCFVSR